MASDGGVPLATRNDRLTRSGVIARYVADLGPTPRHVHRLGFGAAGRVAAVLELYRVIISIDGCHRLLNGGGLVAAHVDGAVDRGFLWWGVVFQWVIIDQAACTHRIFPTHSDPIPNQRSYPPQAQLVGCYVRGCCGVGNRNWHVSHTTATAKALFDTDGHQRLS